jgi:hypothetical protein
MMSTVKVAGKQIQLAKSPQRSAAPYVDQSTPYAAIKLNRRHSMQTEVRVEYFNESGKVVKGGHKVFSFKGSDDVWYSTGFNKPNIAKGQTISFDYTEDNYGKKAIVGTIKVLQEAAPGGNASKGGSAKKWSGGGGKDDYWANKDAYDKQVRQPLIMYQSATNAAVSLAVAALNNGILPTAGAKKADKYESFINIVSQIRDEVYLDYARAAGALEAGNEAVTSDDVPFAKEKLIPDEEGSDFPEDDSSDDGWV